VGDLGDVASTLAGAGRSCREPGRRPARQAAGSPGASPRCCSCPPSPRAATSSTVLRGLGT
jgi:hypothetical protein